MKLKDRLEYLQEKIKASENAGISYLDIRIFENELMKLVGISRWLEAECKSIDRIYRDGSLLHKGKWYFILNNTTDTDFKYIKANVRILCGGALVGTMPVQIKDFPRGKSSKVYLNCDIRENSILSIDADNVDYEVKM